MRKLLLIIALAVVVAAMLLTWVRAQSGFSTRAEPSRVEQFIATTLRRASIPSGARKMGNPFSATPAILAEARAHFADHCASCHANNGSGDTELGRNLYPRAPDMRTSTTQSLGDGELYWIIHNGIRLSGMPAWGDPAHDDDSWKLVAFIRHLPALTADEEAEMEGLNPKARSEIEEEERDRRFLAGDDEPDDHSSSSKGHHSSASQNHQSPASKRNQPSALKRTQP